VLFSASRVVIAGLKGGSGKTIVTLGLIRAFIERGLTVAPFKKGPDYIDAGWMALVASTPCYNLDLFLISPEEILSSFITHSLSSDIAVVEGNRGLFDGRDSEGTNSTAELSCLIKSPVIVVLDCTKSTRTMAAVVKGCQVFEPHISLKGVILNNIGGKRHESIVTDTIEKYCDLPVLGVVPRMDTDILPMRHLGLTPHQELREIEAARKAFAQITQYIDVDSIVDIARSAPPFTHIFSSQKTDYSGEQKTSIGVLKDSAFQFYYPDNIEKLRLKGADIQEISALSDRELPQVDALYIGGGFPETHAIVLAQNNLFRSSLKKAIEEGIPVYAECGGLMYLGQYLLIEGKRYPMCGVLPLSFVLEPKPQAHGYTVVDVVEKNPYFPPGLTLKGHEFHYSKVIDYEKKNTHFAFKVKRGEGIYNKRDGLCYKNVFATYTHLHAAGSPQWVEGMIQASQNRVRLKQ
jgi:cobyrinic acid a,c-diamide synthase